MQIKKVIDRVYGHRNMIYIFYITVLFLMNFVRIFNNDFWGDEAYTILLLKSDFNKLIGMTAGDVHPPLYYIIAKGICEILGHNGVVYHITAFLPYVITMFLGITVIKKRYGKWTSIIFLSFLSLLRSAVIYNLEVRMYSWGALFVLLSFIEFLALMETGKIRSWIGFGVFSIAAAYTHYYCLISVAFFYIIIIFYTIKERKFIYKTIGLCVATIVLYLPWLVELLNTFKRTSTSTGFWQTEVPTFFECVLYLFDSRFDCILLILFILIISEIIYKILNNDDTDKELLICILSGVISIVGTIGVGLAVSYCIRPMFITRYLYPISAVAWLIFSICLPKCNLRKLYILSSLILLLGYGVPHFITVYTYERQSNLQLEKTLDLTTQIDEEDIMFSDIEHIVWTISKLYYPNTQINNLDLDSLPDFKKGTEYWFILSEPINEVIGLEKALELDVVVENGILGTNEVWIYRGNIK